MVTGQVSVTLDLRNTQGKNQKQPERDTRMYILYILKYTPAVISNIVSKLIFASCV